MKLSQYFIGVAAKRLSIVETDPVRSNQHEFNGVAELKRILGEDKRRFPAKYLYLGSESEDTLSADGSVTWYDSREHHPKRTEYRLYFTTSDVSRLASAGDLVIFGRRPDDTMLVVVVQAGSSMESQLTWLFDLPGTLDAFVVQKDWTDRDLDLSVRTILEALEIEVPMEDDQYLDMLLHHFEGSFPSTKVFSNFARSTLSDISPVDDPDRALLLWLEREEMLFRTLEKHIVGMKLKEGFNHDVDDFISYSLSVQNRRKSRIGFAFELHLQCIFDAHQCRYDRGVVTEQRSRPDFLFPGLEEYNDTRYPVSFLTMLGVKSSCKDRWRQILSEAARLEERHLITLEPGISNNQTDEMVSHGVQLVIPFPLQRTFTEPQRTWLMSLKDFIDMVHDKASFAKA